jgi:type II secretory pathway pseudopilin PulG
MHRRFVPTSGFTIVEIGVTILIIGILAILGFVGYRGFQDRAATLSLQSDLATAASQIELDNRENGSFPATKELSNNNAGLITSDGTTFQYTFNPNSNSYCLTATSDRPGVSAWHISSISATPEPVKGPCVGHTDPNAQAPQIPSGWLVSTVAGGPTNGVADGTGAAAQFSLPSDIAIDTAGNLYAVDTGSSRIRKIAPSGVVTTLAGSTQGFADGTGAAAQFSFPRGVTVDATGNVYVADTFTHRIRKVAPSGVVTTLAGSGIPGVADGTGVTAQFNNPSGVTVDSAGNIYVTESYNHRIRKISPMRIVTTLAGSTQGFADGTSTAAKFNEPQNVAIDSTGSIYVADGTNHRIRKITPSGAVTTLAGSGVSGFADGTGASAQFNAPSGVAVDSDGNVYVADFNNNRIRKLVPQF